MGGWVYVGKDHVRRGLRHVYIPPLSPSKPLAPRPLTPSPPMSTTCRLCVLFPERNATRFTYSSLKYVKRVPSMDGNAEDTRAGALPPPAE